MALEDQIKAHGVQDVINDNEQFSTWIGGLTLAEVLNRCPGILSDIMEEFNNDWIEAVETAAENIGIDLAAEPFRKLLAGVHDECGIQCSERGGEMSVYASGNGYSLEYVDDETAEVEIESIDEAGAVQAMIDFCELPARWYPVTYGADA